MPTLYEIAADITALNDLLFEAEGDISDETTEAAIDAWLQENQLALETKLDSYCALIFEREARSAARAVEAKRLLALVSIDENKTRQLRDRLKNFFDQHGLSKIETKRFKLALVRNGGLAPLILNEEWKRDPASAPEEFHQRTITLNTALIRTKLENNEVVERCAIAERGTHLRIK